MTASRTQCVRRLALALFVALAPTPGQAQWPEKPIRLYVPFPAGGAVDIVARVIAAKLADDLGKPVVVENKAGAGCIIATDATAKAAPDGTTLLLTTPNHTINAALQPTLPYDTVKDIAPVSIVAEVPEVLVSHPTAPFRVARKLNMLGIASRARSRLMPQTPTIAEMGLPGYEGILWIGVVAPGGTPKPVIDRLAAASTRAARAPDVVEHFQKIGVDPVGGTTAEFAALLARELPQWRELIKAANIKTAIASTRPVRRAARLGARREDAQPHLVDSARVLAAEPAGNSGHFNAVGRHWRPFCALQSAAPSPTLRTGWVNAQGCCSA